MKTIALNLALIILSSTLFMACEKDNVKIAPSNTVTTLQHTITDFDELNISAPFEVYVTFSNTEQQLRIEANDNLHPVIDVEQNNGKLSIKLERNTTINNGTYVLKAFVTTNDIKAIKGEGIAKIYLQNEWNEDRPEIDLEGASVLTGVINANHLYAKLEGASDLEIQGSTNIFDIDAEGACYMEGFDFETNELKTDLEGGCEISVTVHEKLDVKAEGASTVYYKGNGVIEDQYLSGGSKIIKVQ